MSFTVDDPVDFPALFRSADRESQRAQRSYLVAFKLRMGAFLVAAFGGATGSNVGGVIAFVAFACALGAELFLATTSPLKTWYEGRAVAESAKTLAWRYMVCGKPFEINATDVDNLFLAQTYSLLQDFGSAPVGLGVVNEHQITDKMRQVRSLDLAERREVYLEGRIHDQQRWYAEKAMWNDRRARGWVLVSIILEIAGLVSGASLMVLARSTLRPFDALGFLATAAGVVTAWLGVKQHRNLATAYSIASQELAAVATELVTVKGEEPWAVFVSHAEGAISREHTLWRASRGLGKGLSP
jgi:SMODS and SLOG-associating 2TM effector domain 3/SMODS and SLOG-associating 2TM effector domain 1